jgi:hypothetical protein
VALSFDYSCCSIFSCLVNHKVIYLSVLSFSKEMSQYSVREACLSPVLCGKVAGRPYLCCTHTLFEVLIVQMCLVLG